MQKPARTREEYIASSETMFGVIASPGYPPDPEQLREHAGRAWDRCFDPSGVARQLMAVLASGDRTKELRRITAPTQVIHGLDDRLVPPRAGRDVAAAIPRREAGADRGHGPRSAAGALGALLQADRRQRRPRRAGRANGVLSTRRSRGSFRNLSLPTKASSTPLISVSGVNGFSTKPASSSRTTSRDADSPV